jgi:hypothetical protein
MRTYLALVFRFPSCVALAGASVSGNMSREALNVFLAVPIVVLATCPGCSQAPAATGIVTDDGGTPPGMDAASGEDAATTGDSSTHPPNDAGGPPPPSTDGGSPPQDAAMPIVCNGPAPARGAALPYQEYEAENAMTNGTVIGPSRAVNDANVDNSIAGESSGRSAVKLTGTGQYVRFTTACTANSIVVRYVIPDSTDGNGISATLGLYVGGTRVQSLSLTSHYAWAYGDPTASDATTNNPANGFARHFYDEVRVLLPSDIPSGSTVALQKDASDSAAYYVVDLVDMEEVPAPIGQPSNSVSITTCGATPNDGTDDGAAIQNCINTAAGQGKTVWIPAGTFNDAATTLRLANVTVQGAGMWHSTIAGASSNFVCTGGACKFADFSVYGEVTLRDDMHGVHAIGGPFGSGSRIDNVWMEHFTAGAWIGQGGSPAVTGMVIHGCRVRDLFADGVNLNTGTSGSTVEHTSARNTGDDAFASWSSGPANTGNTFRFDTAQLPWRAGCFAIYGGSNNAVDDSVCADGITYPGIMIDENFGATAFGGTTSVLRDDVVRAGGDMFGIQWGAVTVAGTQKVGPITGVTIGNVNIKSSTFSGIFFTGPNDAISNLVLDTVAIAQPGTYGIEADPSTTGIMTASNVVVTGPGAGKGLINPAASVFTIDRGAGDTGW